MLWLCNFSLYMFATVVLRYLFCPRIFLPIQYEPAGRWGKSVVDVPEEGDVDAVLLPQLLEALAALWLLEGALHGVPQVGRVAQHAVRREDEPRLVLPVHRREAVLNELVLCRALPPVVLSVRDAEPEHAVVHLVPEVCSVLGRVVVHSLGRHAALATGSHCVKESPGVGPFSLVVAACDHIRLLRSDGCDLGRELIPLGNVTVGVGQVADVEHDVVVVQILDQPVGRVQRPRLVVREHVRSVPLSLSHVTEYNDALQGVLPRERRRTERAGLAPHDGPVLKLVSNFVVVLFVGPQVPQKRCVDETGVSPPNRARRLTAHAAAAEGERPGGRALWSGGAADDVPLHERVRLADVVSARPCHRHLVVGLALREAREHGRLGVRERDRLRHRDKLRRWLMSWNRMLPLPQYM
uniref:Uncharacterized protein n=1 Tax=Arundo donax TaxID=35708 RepID=A0A0A9DMF7_ARUDO